MNTENYQEEFREVNGTKVRIATYKISNEFYCHIYNADPGATIARANGSTAEAAMQKALEKATGRIKQAAK
jgi:hypothetical protein